MGINRIFESLSKIDSGNQEKIQSKAVTPAFVSTIGETNTAEKRSNQQTYEDYRRTQIQALWTELQQNQVGSKQTTKQTDELKPMYEGVKTTAELNQKLLETIKAVDPQPTGLKPHLIKKTGKMTAGGVEASENAAKLHAQSMSKNDLKAKFERLGEKYGVPPALIAGIASRESDMGGSLVKKGKYAGWGDYGTRKKHGETSPSYHGFGLIQVDRKTAPLGINKELQAAYGKTPLDPFSEEHIEWGVKVFLDKFGKAKADFPKLSEANQIATGVSKYNGGIKGAAYPRTDAGTTGHDYGNDVLVQARWFANNWDKLK